VVLLDRRFVLLMETKFGSRKKLPYVASAVALKSAIALPRSPLIEMPCVRGRVLKLSSVCVLMLRAMRFAWDVELLQT